MLMRKIKPSKYILRLSSSRVTPTSSLSDIEWDKQTKTNRKTTLRWSSKKGKYAVFTVACALAIAILIAIAILVPLISTSKTSTTKNTETAPSVTNIMNISINFTTTTFTIITLNTSTTATSQTTTITTTSQTSTETQTTSTSTTFTTQGTSTSTSSQITSALATTETTTGTQTTSSSTTSQTASTTQNTSSSTTSTTQSTSSSTTSATTSTTQSTSSSTTSATTSTTQSTSSSTSSTTTSTTRSTSSSTSSTTTSTTRSTSSSTTSTSSTSTVTISFRWNQTGVSVLGAATLQGIASNHLNFPISIVFDSSNTMYVADARNNRTQKLLFGNTAATTVAGNPIGTGGSTASLLNYPNDVAVDSNGNVYVVDTNNNRVQLWYVNATSGITIAGDGTAGNSTTQFDSPRGIVFDSNPSIYYISDANNNRVMQYTLNSTVGTLIAGGNGAGTNNTQLSNPRGLYFDSTTNSLFIANTGANNIVKYVIGALSWTLVAGDINGVSGTGSTFLNTPYDVTLDPMGNVYVADRFNERIQFFLAGQMNGTTIAGVTGVTGSSSTLFIDPISVALDSQLNLYVADLNNARIQKFIRY